MEGFLNALPREGLMINRMAVLHHAGVIVSVLHQNEGGIGKSTPDARDPSMAILFIIRECTG